MSPRQHKRELKKRMFWYRISLITAYFAIAILFFLIGAIVFDSNPLAFTNSPFPVDKRIYLPDEQVNMTIGRCLTYETEMQYIAYLVTLKTGSDEAQLDSGIVNLSKGCTTINGIPMRIPQNVSEGGKYIRYEMKVKGRLNQFKINERTESFEIVKDKDRREELLLKDGQDNAKSTFGIPVTITPDTTINNSTTVTNPTPVPQSTNPTPVPTQTPTGVVKEIFHGLDNTLDTVKSLVPTNAVIK